MCQLWDFFCKTRGEMYESDIRHGQNGAERLDQMYGARFGRSISHAGRHGPEIPRDSSDGDDLCRACRLLGGVLGGVLWLLFLSPVPHATLFKLSLRARMLASFRPVLATLLEQHQTSRSEKIRARDIDGELRRPARFRLGQHRLLHLVDRAGVCHGGEVLVHHRHDAGGVDEDVEAAGLERDAADEGGHFAARGDVAGVGDYVAEFLECVGRGG